MNPSISINPGSSILIVLMGSVGDVARGLCLVHQIKSQVPSISITWLVEPKSFELVKLHKGIDRVILFERGRGISAILKLRRDLRLHKFDLVLDLQRHAKSGLFSKLSGAPRRIGFNRADAKEFNHLFSTEQIPPYGSSVNKLDHYLNFLPQLGLSVVQPLEFGLREPALKQVVPPEFSTLPQPVAGIVLGSAWESKDWVVEGYDALIDQLLKLSNFSVVLLGDRTKANLGMELSRAHKSNRLISLAGTTSLSQLVSIIAHLAVACGPDSGPGHIAAALGVPYVAIFGATDPRRTAPYDCHDLVVRSSIGCSPCYRRVCPGLNRLCMRLIRPQEVFDRMRVAVGESYTSRQ